LTGNPPPRLSTVVPNPIAEGEVSINETIREVISLVASELVKNQILLWAELSDELPPVLGD